jgi:hypothetical protein
MKLFFILIYFIIPTYVYTFPGDQDPLSCIRAFKNTEAIREAFDARQKLFAKGLAKSVTVIEDGETKVYDFTYGSTFQTTNYPGLTEEKYKEEIKNVATEEFRAAIRAFHDRSVSITKLGDSLSDFVDVYGVIKPEYWGLHPAFGAIGRNPFYMDSWDDYFSLGIYYPTEFFKVSNYSRVGDATSHTLSLLGVYKNSRESQDVLPSSNFCVLKRGIEINFGVNQTDPTNDPHSALRSSLNIQ